MTRTEQLAIAAAKAKERLGQKQKDLARIERAQRVEQRKMRDTRRAEVGMLADAAGLLAWESTTLAGLFTALATLKDVPNPVAVLEGLLQASPHAAVSPLQIVTPEASASQEAVLSKSVQRRLAVQMEGVHADL